MGWPGPATHRQHAAWDAYLDDFPTTLEVRVLQVAHEARWAGSTKSHPPFRSTDWDLKPDTRRRNDATPEHDYADGPTQHDVPGSAAERGMTASYRQNMAQRGVMVRSLGGTALKGKVTRDEADALAVLPLKEQQRLRRLRAEGRW